MGVPVIALDSSGSSVSSVEFAYELQKYENIGRVQFVIGGSHGLALPLLKPNFVLSLSSMTFEHDLVRLILLEQLYRALDINHGGAYHK